MKSRTQKQEAAGAGSRVRVITVDGPSGAGKGLITRLIAEQLGWRRLDSGALYRILALVAQAAGRDLDDGAAVAELASKPKIEFRGRHEDEEIILVDGEDWTKKIRAEATANLASRIAAAPPVRAALLARQRAFRQPPGLVADGRDMGTVVFPDADLKFFLDASVEARARRRLNQLAGKSGKQLRDKGSGATLRALCEEVRARDDRDRSRAIAPLAPAPDAIVLDTTHLTPAEVMAEIERHLMLRGFIDPPLT